MALASSEAVVQLPAGVALHARPAGLFVRTAAGFRSRITVSAGGRDADAKSILAVLALGAGGGAQLLVRAEGEDADAAVAALSSCLTTLVE
ncbi:MAG TPA: HPr family phosphocarrier protein [Candidatus Dormibacteraeota bacterium]